MKVLNFIMTGRRCVVLLAPLFLFCLMPAAWAQSDAFSVEVAVSQRSHTEERDAYMAGLRRVLLNNSGDKTILNRDLVRQELQSAQKYVKAFSYRRPPSGTVLAVDTPITPSVQQSGEATQLMLVSFDRTLVNQLISDSAPAVVNREDDTQPEPAAASNSALVWLLIRDDNRDILVSDPAAANVQARALEIAGAAGISLVYPSGDAEDEQLMSVEDIAAQSFIAENLATISQRYAQDTLLIGYLSRVSTGGWLGQWTQVSVQQQQQQAQFEASTLDQALQQGLGVLGSVAQIDETFRYGGRALSDAEGLVWVGSLSSTEDYARMMRFFESINSVGTVYPKEIQDNSVVFSVVPRSALANIESAVFNTSWLQRSAAPLTDDINSQIPNADLSVQHSR